MWRYELHPPNLINGATLPCESQNTENVILQRDVTKTKLQQMHYSFIKVDRPGSSCAFHLLIWGVIQQNVCETKIHDIDDLRKRLMQTCFDFDRNIINAGVTIWDHVCMMVVETLNACSDLNVHYMIHQNILWNCQCKLIHITVIL